MASHYVAPGTTPLKVGHVYSRHSMNQASTWDTYRLKSVNEATGQCWVTSVHGGWSFWISATMLSQWHIVGGPER